MDDGPWVWDIAMRCTNPTGREIYASEIDLLNRRRIVWVAMQLRCRKCAMCLKVKGWEWADRAAHECGLWPRSYLVTLTLTVENQYRALAEASADLAAEAVDMSKLSVTEQFAHRCSVISQWITLYMKRVRKDLGVPLRFILVAEAHRNGLPHFHMLIHEVVRATPDAWDTYSAIKSQWGLGHSSVNGIDHTDGGRAARYVCKYITKSGTARVRASKHYGRLQAPQVPESRLTL